MICFDFTDKVVIITGSGQGMGERMAIDFAEANAKVVVTDLKEELIDNVKNILLNEKKIPESRLLFVKADVSKKEDVENLISKTMEKFSRVDILINNAGILVSKSIEETSDKLIDDTIDINIKGVLYAIRAVTPIMKNQKYGKIINMSSITGKNGDNSTTFVYGASKGALISMTKSVARQLGPYNVNCNAIAPHAVMTKMMYYWDDEKKKSMSDKIPLKRLCNVEDASYLTLFLSSDYSSFITGETITLNGGYYMD